MLSNISNFKEWLKIRAFQKSAEKSKLVLTDRGKYFEKRGTKTKKTGHF